MENLSSRMKKYEYITRHYLCPKIPVIIRLDGKCFHSFTKKAEKPFDQKIIDSMVFASEKVAEEISGFKIGYIQSDEANFLITDYDNLETQGWFDYNLSKVLSISSAIMSVQFNRYYYRNNYDGKTKLAVFDARAFNIPKEEVANYFLFRAKDWKRNSIQMYAQSFFSHKQLHKKKQEDIHEMLHNIGKNWTTDLTNQQKNGTFIVKEEQYFGGYYTVLPNYESISKFIEEFN